MHARRSRGVRRPTSEARREEGPALREVRVPVPSQVTIDLLSFGCGMVVGIVLFIAALPLFMRAQRD